MIVLRRRGVEVRRWARKNVSVRTPKVEVPVVPAVVPTRGRGPFHRVRAIAIKVARQGVAHLRERRPGLGHLVPLVLPPGGRPRRARAISAQHPRGSSQSGAVRLPESEAVPLPRRHQPRLRRALARARERASPRVPLKTARPVLKRLAWTPWYSQKTQRCRRTLLRTEALSATPSWRLLVSVTRSGSVTS